MRVRDRTGIWSQRRLMANGPYGNGSGNDSATEEKLSKLL